jgi:hypothetical protein
MAKSPPIELPPRMMSRDELIVEMASPNGATRHARDGRADPAVNWLRMGGMRRVRSTDRGKVLPEPFGCCRKVEIF